MKLMVQSELVEAVISMPSFILTAPHATRLLPFTMA